MRFIEIAEGLNLNVEEIDSISVGDDGITSIVRTHHNVYRSTLPAGALVELLQRMTEEYMDKETKAREQVISMIKKIGYFAG